MTHENDDPTHDKEHDRIYLAFAEAVDEALNATEEKLFQDMGVVPDTERGLALTKCIRQEIHGLMARLTGLVETEVRVLDRVDPRTLAMERARRFEQGVDDAREEMYEDGTLPKDHDADCPHCGKIEYS